MHAVNETGISSQLDLNMPCRLLIQLTTLESAFDMTIVLDRPLSGVIELPIKVASPTGSAPYPSAIGS